jgi:ABC-type nickel/cobalt efflux system permease component RcnA
MAALRGISIVVLIVAAFAGSAAAQSPLLGGRGAGSPPAEAPAKAVRAEPPPQTALGQASRWLAQTQQTMVNSITREVKSVKDGDSYVPLLFGMLFAFLYGVVHTLGPGHGKFVVASYFIGREASIWRGLRMASEIAVTHVIAAVLLVWLTDVAVRVLFGAATGELYWSRLISYGVLAAIGAWMLAQSVRRLVGGRAEHAHDAACGHDHGGAAGGASEGRQRGLLSIGVGVAPCTGAILVMVFALANDVLAAGVMMVAAIGLGMAATMFVIGVAAILARGMLIARVGREQRRARNWQGGLELVGALAIVVFSTALFLDAL